MTRKVCVGTELFSRGTIKLVLLPLLVAALLNSEIAAALPPATVAHQVATAPKTPRAPYLDGEAESLWARCSEYSITRTIEAPSFDEQEDTAGPYSPLPSFSGSWKVLWDKDNLYIFLKVLNDNTKDKLSPNNGFIIYTSANYTRKYISPFKNTYEAGSDTCLHFAVDALLDKEMLYGDPNLAPGTEGGPFANPSLFYYDEFLGAYLPKWPPNYDGRQQYGELTDPTVVSEEQRRLDFLSDPNNSGHQEYYPEYYLPVRHDGYDTFRDVYYFYFPQSYACIKTTPDGYHCEIQIPWTELAYSPKEVELEWDANKGVFRGGTGPYSGTARDYLGFEFELVKTDYRRTPFRKRTDTEVNVTKRAWFGGPPEHHGDFAPANTSGWGTLQLLPQTSILGTECTGDWAIFENDFKWRSGIGFVYDAYYPFIYIYDSASWLYVFSDNANEADGYFIYDFSRNQLGFTGCAFYPYYAALGTYTLIPLGDSMHPDAVSMGRAFSAAKAR
ncbi:MAG: hypothetical protein SFY80_12250 [Verrucomicrobiota bacterium]|nr:hypothetical protein [Verrucomicrobiota bacterium]